MSARKRSSEIDLQLLANPFLNFLEDLHVLLGLHSLSLLIENFHLLYLVMGDFQLTLEKVVLVLEDFCLLYDSFGLSSVLLLADLVV